MRKAPVALLLLVSCASPHVAQIEVKPGALSSSKDLSEPVKVSSKRYGKRTRDGFIYVDVTLENTGADFVSVRAHALTARDGMPAMQIVGGKELAAWIEDEANREEASARHRHWAFTALTVAGALVGVGGAIGHSTSAGIVGGVAVAGGVGGSIATSVSAENDALNSMYPDDHLLAEEITLAPHARVQRWFLLRVASEQIAKAELVASVDTTIIAQNGNRDRRYLLTF